MADQKISQLSSGAPAQAGDEYVIARSGANYKLTLTNIAANMPATTISSGNLTFSSTGQRITGDFSNATIASRLLFQTSTTNGATSLNAIPNGSATTSSFGSFNSSDPANASLINLIATSTEVGLQNAITGTGTYLPMTFFTGGSERMRIDSSGNVGIGGTAGAASKLNILGTYTASGNNAFAVQTNGTIPSGATTNGIGFLTGLNTQAASFTCSQLTHFYAQQGTIGASSAVTSQFGFYAESSLTGATTNYGFYSNIASGSNRYNFYAAGTAFNYFAGDTAIGRANSTSVRLFVQGANTSTDYALVCYNSAETTLFYARNNGEFATGTAASSPYNNTTANAANVEVDSSGILRRSTSSLRYKSNVADATHGLADVLKLRSVTYKGKNDGDKVFGGLIAEEVHDAGLTEFVAYDKEGQPDALHYGNMVALLVKAVQELSAKVAALEAK